MAEPRFRPLLLAREVALIFGVREATVKAWATDKPEWIGAIRTPGNQWRFVPEKVEAALGRTMHE